MHSISKWKEGDSCVAVVKSTGGLGSVNSEDFDLVEIGEEIEQGQCPLVYYIIIGISYIIS